MVAELYLEGSLQGGSCSCYRCSCFGGSKMCLVSGLLEWQLNDSAVGMRLYEQDWWLKNESSSGKQLLRLHSCSALALSL